MNTKIFSPVLGVLGILFIFLSLYPIAEYEYMSRRRFPKLVSPIPAEVKQSILTVPLKDYKSLRNWSLEYVVDQEEKDAENAYLLSIPELKIKDAEVYEGGEDLSRSLIQYPGTARPGQVGNTVIFGHSVLPVFYNPKNYISIFSTIPKLERGDEIFVNVGNIEYKYKVVEMFEVEPDNLNILDQRSNDSYLSLVTCVPPGHPLKPRRLVVKAEIVD